jgi:hypothetical protein
VEIPLPVRLDQWVLAKHRRSEGLRSWVDAGIGTPACRDPRPMEDDTPFVTLSLAYHYIRPNHRPTSDRHIG